MKPASYNEFLAFISSESKTGDRSSECKNSEILTTSNAIDLPAQDPKLHGCSIPISSTGQCPFRHGTVYADPYPGYCHGNPNKGICPNKCRPKLTSEITKLESPKETLKREAMEYLELYYHERLGDMKGSDGFLLKEERMKMVNQSIEETGTYEHTFDELEHGARLAWRNAPKCSNRKYWQQLKLIDARGVSTNQGMRDACMHHLEKMRSGSSEAYVTVFKPAHPGDKDGPRIWNSQLLQYAAYRKSDESFATEEVIGDPKNLRFTQMLDKRFGWTGPRDGIKTPYDYLPLVIQVDPDGSPELFEVPLEIVRPVFITHNDYPKLSKLGLRWYPIPAVSGLDMEIGGLVYTCCPFNGWYANTEIVRDLTDEDRYNLLVPIGKILGLNVEERVPLWIDTAMAILSAAVYQSFEKAKISITDHHTLIQGFYEWYNLEMKERKYCPANWKWIIPPMSPSTSPAYLKLNKAREYTIKPAFVFGRSFTQLEEKWFGPPDTTKAFNDVTRMLFMVVGFKRMIARFRSRKLSVLIVFASVTGNASRWANEMGSILRPAANVSFLNACRIKSIASELQDILNRIQSSSLILFVSSTIGNGELPSESCKFFSFLFDDHGYVLVGKECGVLGFGNSSYPIFCGAAAHISNKLAEHGAKEIIAWGKCDSLKGEASAFYSWTANLVATLSDMPDASSYMLDLSQNMHNNTLTRLAQHRHLMNSVLVEVFTSKQVERAAGASFVQKRKRRSSLDNSFRQSFTNQSQASNGGNLSSSFTCDTSSQEEMSRIEHLMNESSITLTNPSIDEDAIQGIVSSREDLIDSDCGRKTSLIKIDIASASGNPYYQPGGELCEKATFRLVQLLTLFSDHVRVFPRNLIPVEELDSFIGHLSGNLRRSSYIYVSLDNEQIARSDLGSSLPLVNKCLLRLIQLEYLFENLVAVKAPISIAALHELSQLTQDDNDKAVLKNMAKNESQGGLKWIDLFLSVPSLSGKVTLGFLLCNLQMNNPRSYSISSCKDSMGSEIHLCVGRFLYNHKGHVTAGVCSDFLTSTEEGDEVLFKLESVPSFHYPSDPSSPIIFICTGTGFAPIRGLLQKREHLRSRGEQMGPAYLVFGSRCSGEGLFHDEIKLLVEKKVIGKCYMCYSREPGKEKVYTSDKLRHERVRAVISPILGRINTHVYICGSAIMSEQCKTALADISSKELIQNIMAEGRLHEDVFGAVASSSEILQDKEEASEGSTKLDSSEASDRTNGSFFINCLDQSYHTKSHLP